MIAPHWGTEPCAQLALDVEMGRQAGTVGYSSGLHSGEIDEDAKCPTPSELGQAKANCRSI
jgi:hypothetical protein